MPLELIYRGKAGRRRWHEDHPGRHKGQQLGLRAGLLAWHGGTPQHGCVCYWRRLEHSCRLGAAWAAAQVHSRVTCLAAGVCGAAAHQCAPAAAAALARGWVLALAASLACLPAGVARAWRPASPGPTGAVRCPCGSFACGVSGSGCAMKHVKWYGTGMVMVCVQCRGGGSQPGEHAGVGVGK